MFTDMVGYTVLTQKDEALAMKLLEEHRAILRPILAKYEGHEIKTIGDSFLVEFSSALDATKCGMEIQNTMRARNAGVDESKIIKLRIGVHIGDIIHSRGDVYGDAVNIASRIEPLASPEGICISQQVFDQVNNKAGIRLSPIGSTRLKNIQTPVSVYEVIFPWNGTEEKLARVALDHNRIAVLPLANISPDSKDEYFSDGLTEELISALSKISDLSVISRTSVVRYKSSDKGIEEIGRELKVDNILEGTVRKAGNRVRITVQLIEVKSDKHTWTESYDREIADIFEIQSDIAQRVAESLKLRLLEDKKSIIEKSATNTDAFTSYLRGRYCLNKHTIEDTERAIEYFEHSLKSDSNYAPACAGLSDCYIYLGDNLLKPIEAYPKARSYAIRALELDDTLAEAHLSLALVLCQYEWDWQNAEKEFRRAFALNPSFAMARFWFTALMTILGRIDEGWSEILQAQRLDPLSLTVNTGVGGVLYFWGRYDQSEVELRKVLEMDSNFALAHERLGLVNVQRAKFEDAIAEFQILGRLTRAPLAKGLLGHVYALKGKFEEARKILKELEESSKGQYVSPFAPALIHLALGEKERTFDLLEMAYEDHSSYFALAGIKCVPISCSPLYNTIRSDPRFIALLSKLGLKDVVLQNSSS